MSKPRDPSEAREVMRQMSIKASTRHRTSDRASLESNNGGQSIRRDSWVNDLKELWRNGLIDDETYRMIQAEDKEDENVGEGDGRGGGFDDGGVREMNSSMKSLGGDEELREHFLRAQSGAAERLRRHGIDASAMRKMKKVEDKSENEKKNSREEGGMDVSMRTAMKLPDLKEGRALPPRLVDAPRVNKSDVTFSNKKGRAWDVISRRQVVLSLEIPEQSNSLRTTRKERNWKSTENQRADRARGSTLDPEDSRLNGSDLSGKVAVALRELVETGHINPDLVMPTQCYQCLIVLTVPLGTGLVECPICRTVNVATCLNISTL